MFIEGQEILEKRYRVIKKLGSGAFGEIYKGRHTLNSYKLADTVVFSGKEKDRRAPGR
jgi:serine/threonine protein kinase